MRIKALVVDDSKLARFVLKQMLVDHGVDADAVASAEEALGYLCKTVPDVIFMDHTMPGMDGLKAVEAIKNDQMTSHVPIYMYTSKEGSVYTQQAKAVGAEGVLPKQLKPEELLSVLKQHNLLSRAKVTPLKPYEEVKDTEQQVRDLHQLTKHVEKTTNIVTQQELAKTFIDDQRVLLEEELKRMKGEILNEIHESVAPNKNKERKLTDESPSKLPWMVAVFCLVVIGWILHSSEVSHQARQQAISGSFEGVNLSVGGGADKSTFTDEISTIDQNVLDLIEWGINNGGEVKQNHYHLGDRLAANLAYLIERLIDIGFNGEVVVSVHVGDFCLINNEAGQAVLAGSDVLVSQCELTAAGAQEATSLANRESIVFGNFMTQYRELTGDLISIRVVNRGVKNPKYRYPNKSDETDASEWNRIAQRNNRVEIELRQEF